ncbi:uncharacterized protein RJT21DRAFT_117449 [Scheffersomyces amazonensis]|uniref:uncharacterized protein n=1 Tax=Scheffersomyces amazonensis TaxID=1078765 RepID=UPI00315D97D2
MSWTHHISRFAVNPIKGKISATKYEATMKRMSLPFQGPSEGLKVPPHERRTQIEKGIVTGDLVYINEGEHKGKVSSVIRYLEESDSYMLNNVSEKTLIPKHMWGPGATSHVFDYPIPIPASHIKLAAKDKDDSGKINYVVADKIAFKEKYYDDRYHQWLPRRFVKFHESIEIPWPEPNSLKDDQYCTIEPIALEKSYELQTIAKPPFPKELLSEFRNPYSHHKKRVFTEVQARRINAPNMPLSMEQKIYLAKQASKPKKVLEPLTEEMKELIGSKMAEHINKIDNPALLGHLEHVSKTKVPDFEKTLKSIEENQTSN